MSREEEVYSFVKYKINYLISVSGQGEGKELFARLRKGVGRSPGDMPELFGILLTGMPEEFMSKGAEPTKEEWSCYIALTLFAMHQQGNDPKMVSMNTLDDHSSVGTAMAQYVSRSDDDNALKRMAVRLETLATSKDMGEMSYYLKSLIQIFKSKEIQLNYPKLAKEMYICQFPERKKGVFLRWGQDLFVNKNINKEKENI